MPIPEPSAYRRSNLTKTQKQEQLATVYGVPMPTENLTFEEAQQMRQLLARFDESSHQQVQIHDLNNPPRLPYKFQKFPMMVYDLVNSQPAHEEEKPSKSGFGIDLVHISARVVSLTVNSEDELHDALANGFSEQAPNFGTYEEPELAPQYQTEANRVQDQLDQAKKRSRRSSYQAIA